MFVIHCAAYAATYPMSKSCGQYESSPRSPLPAFFTMVVPSLGIALRYNRPGSQPIMTALMGYNVTRVSAKNHIKNGSCCHTRLSYRYPGSLPVTVNVQFAGVSLQVLQARPMQDLCRLSTPRCRGFMIDHFGCHRLLDIQVVSCSNNQSAMVLVRRHSGTQSYSVLDVGNAVHIAHVRHVCQCKTIAFAARRLVHCHVKSRRDGERGYGLLDIKLLKKSATDRLTCHQALSMPL